MKFLRTTILSVLICMIIYAMPASCRCDEEHKEDKGWVTIKSDYFMIYCDPSIDLKSLARRLHRRGWAVSGSYKSDSSDSPERKVGKAVDGLFRRAEEILDMHPHVSRWKIKIFADKKALDNEYFNTFLSNENPVSFYVHGYEAIYTCEDEISDTVLVHEMAHAIIDHYFAVVPPGKIAELIAQFVDSHLED